MRIESVSKAQMIAPALAKGAKKACLAMTGDWQFAGKATFNANGAHSLHWGGYLIRKGELCEAELQKDGKWSRTAYRLTPTGLAVRAVLEQSA